MTVIIVTAFRPTHLGTGGNHRSYQIVCDAQRAAGPTNVIVLSWPIVKAVKELELKLLGPSAAEQEDGGQPRNRLSYNLDRVRRYSQKTRENLFHLLSRTSFVLSPWGEASLVRRYRGLLRTAKPNAVCVIDHPSFRRIILLNRELGIPTIGAFHNLESLDVDGPLQLQRKWNVWTRIGDLIAELAVLNACDERLFISQVEAGFVGGLGIRSKYYPYKPAGIIAQWLRAIRGERVAFPKNARQPGMFLLLGSAVHAPTAEGIAWFLRNVKEHGLPGNVQLVVAGAGTDRLAAPNSLRLPIRLCGWVSAQELRDLLIQANAVIVPHRHGFGAVTRLTELTAAGIPVIASEHALLATGNLAGVSPVDDQWSSWCCAIENHALRTIPEEIREEVSDSESALCQSLLRHRNQVSHPK